MIYLHHLLYIAKPWTLRLLLILIEATGPKAYATDRLGPGMVEANGSCPRVIVEAVMPDGKKLRCLEGSTGCFDSPDGLKVMQELKQGCAEGRGGPGSPCMYGLLIDKTGHGTVVCGPRLLDTKR